ncbi:hypothetical protein V8C43DRAFT_268916 [Trichoderma afarasin]
MVPKFAARQLCMDLFLFVSTFAGFIATLPRCPITLRQREIKRHWIRIKKTQCVRYSFGGYATSLHRSHCPPKRRLHGTLLHGASDAASTFSCISKKRCLNNAPGFGTRTSSRRNHVGISGTNSARSTPQKKRYAGKNPCTICASTIPWKPGQASGPLYS